MPLEGSAIDLDAVVLDSWDFIVCCRTPVLSDLLQDLGPNELRDELGDCLCEDDCQRLEYPVTAVGSHWAHERNTRL